MSYLTPDALAVVRACDVLTEQVRRIADALSPLTAEVPAAAPTDARKQAYDSVYTYIRGLGDAMPPSRIERNAMIWGAVNTALDTYAVATLPPACSAPAADPFSYEERERTGRNAGLTIPRRSPDPADERRDARRDSIRNLLDRAGRGVLGASEAELLRNQVEAEMRVSDQLRAGRTTWKTKAEEIEQIRDGLAEDLKREQAASSGLAGKIREQRAALDTAHRRAERAEAAIAHVRALAEEHPAGIDTALILEALPDPTLDDSGPSPVEVVHPEPNPQASEPPTVDEEAALVDKDGQPVCTCTYGQRCLNCRA